MKKLYENIEDINIKGGVSQLSEVIRAMDISLQNIADNSDQLTTYLVRYSAANKGSQFEKVVKVSSALRDKLYQASLELNDMQNQIVVYQNKIYRYEDLPENAKKYIAKVEDLIGAPIGIISVGPDREQTIFV